MSYELEEHIQSARVDDRAWLRFMFGKLEAENARLRGTLQGIVRRCDYRSSGLPHGSGCACYYAESALKDTGQESQPWATKEDNLKAVELAKSDREPTVQAARTPEVDAAVSLLFPLGQSAPGEDGCQTVLFDDGEFQLMLEIGDAKIKHVFWRNRRTETCDGFSPGTKDAAQGDSGK